MNHHKAGRPFGKGATLVALIASGSLLAVGCSAPGATTTTQASSTASTVAQTCGSDPVTMKGYFETGLPLPKALTDEFTKQFPNVTWDIRHPDVQRVSAMAADQSALDTLEALALSDSIRAAASLLNLHHSTVQQRQARLEEALGFHITSPSGRTRVLVALASLRLRDFGDAPPAE